MTTKLDICIAVPGLPFNGENFDSLAIGGSESAGYYIGRALAARGHRVTVFSNTEKRIRCKDVDYIPLSFYSQYCASTLHDVSIVQRSPRLFGTRSLARFSAVWCHDLAMLRQEGDVKGSAWNYDRLFVLSDFMAAQYKEVYGLPEGLLFKTRNGVDLATVQAVRTAREALPQVPARNPLSLVYSARPERGLDVLLSEVMPRVLKYEPQARLFYCAYHNPVDHLAEFYSQCEAQAQQLGEHAVNLGALTKAQLYEVYLSAGLYVYPVPSLFAPDFDEISPVHGDTIIQTVSGPKRIRDLEGKKGFHVYSRKENGKLGVSCVEGVWRTRRSAKVITLRLRPGRGVNAKKETMVTLTPDHEVMLKDGTYRQAGRLGVGDRVMAVTANYESRDGVEGYQTLRITGELQKYGHRIVMESILGRALKKDEVVHHEDGNEANNEPSNLFLTNQRDHRKEHWQSKTFEERTEENLRRSKTAKKTWNTPEGKKSRSTSAHSYWDSLSFVERSIVMRQRAKRRAENRLGENHIVVAVEEAPCADVFCMEVEPDHNFIANEIVVHNCVSLMEAQACGLPVVASQRGALPETLAPGAGTLVPGPVHTPEYYDAFSDAVLSYMRDPSKARAASAAGLVHAQTLDWSGVAEQWVGVFFDSLQAKSNDYATLANHFWRRSDIYAAQECLAQLPEDDPKSRAVRERIQTDWGFLEEPDGFRRQYERIGATHNSAVLEYAAQEPRYQALRTWLQKNAGAVQHVLDYGCAHGAYAVNLLKDLPALHVTGVDIDQHGIEMAYGFAEKLGVADRWRGVVGGEARLIDDNVPEMCEQYDAVIAQEVLEHVSDPTILLQALEQRVRDGGFVYITVPFGPWEYSDYRRYPFRAHLWEYDLHDLYDLLDAAKGATADVHVYAMVFGNAVETDDALGWWVVQYRVTPETRGKVGRIDMQRKLRLQAPRQTVSAAIIAGPNCEETLHWCLKSLIHVADEVVIADCGMSAEAHRVLDTYRWKPLTLDALGQNPNSYFLDIKVVPGVDPKVHGFETPRNIALEHCTQDWVLWIDTDEKLLEPQKLAKYLRSNVFQGYSLKQHHFAVDTHFDPDLPVRLFRNNGRLRFFGCVHEHPEEELNKGPGLTIVLGDVHVPHVGYLVESGRKLRFARNLPMLQADMKKYPDRILQKHFIMRDTMLLVTYELQQNGARVTEGIRARCREVVQLYRQYFLGKGHISNIDPISYYSQAVQLLGEGFDAAIQLTTDKVDAKPNGALKVRFANQEDFLTEVAHRAKQVSQPFETRYY